jgi:uncharacterized cupin superfamily protein
MTRLRAGVGADVGTLPLTHEPVPSDQVIAGAPTTGWIALDESDAGELGVWEHTPGTSTDVESDEVFVVLSGSGTLEFVDPVLASVELRPGVIVRLSAGMRTVWIVRETLRKVYLTP